MLKDYSVKKPGPVAFITFGTVKICCKTGEVTGLSDDISEDAKIFWKHIKENIIGLR